MPVPDPAADGRITLGSSGPSRRAVRAADLRGEERAEAIDRLRRASRELTKLAMIDAGMGAGARLGRPSFGLGRKAIVRCASLVALSPDIDALQLQANALLAGRRFDDAVAQFARIVKCAPDRLHCDAAELGISIGTSFLRRPTEARRACLAAMRSSYEIVAGNGALTMVVQSTRRDDVSGLRYGLDASAAVLGAAAAETCARLLSNYFAGATAADRLSAMQVLRCAGPFGAFVAGQLGEILESCDA